MPDSPSFAARSRVAVERFSLRNLVLALVVAVLCAGFAAALSMRGPDRYQSFSVLLIDNPLALATSGNDATVNKLEQLRGKYATLASTEVVAGPVGETVGLPAGAVMARTDVRPAPATLSLLVVASGDDPVSTRELARAMANGLAEFVVDEHKRNAVPAADRFVLEVVQPATPPSKSSPSSDAALTAAAITFVVAISGAYLALQFLRPPVPPGERLPRSDEPTDPTAVLSNRPG